MGCSIKPKGGQFIFCYLQEVFFSFKLEKNTLFFHSGPHTLKQTLEGRSRHFEYFLCEHSVPGRFLPQGTVYLI